MSHTMSRINVVHRFSQSPLEPDGENNISIMKDSSLAQCFKIGECFCHKPAVIQTKADVQEAYEHLLRSKIEWQCPHIIKILDHIAFKTLDGHTVNLIGLGDIEHGYVIKKIIEEKIDEIHENNTNPVV